MNNNFDFLFTFLFLLSNKFLFIIIRLYALNFFLIEYSSLLTKVLIIKLFIVLKSIIAINCYLLILISIIKYYIYIVKFSCYC